jgi:hypothetical protein
VADTEDIPEEEETPHVFVRGEGGGVFKLDLPLHETIEDRLLKGYLTRVANAKGDAYVEGSDEESVPTLPTERPALNAVKKEWVGWAVAQGMLPDDAEAFTKQDLIERFGANAPGPIATVPPGVPDPSQAPQSGEPAPADPPTTDDHSTDTPPTE